MYINPLVPCIYKDTTCENHSFVGVENKNQNQQTLTMVSNWPPTATRCKTKQNLEFFVLRGWPSVPGHPPPMQDMRVRPPMQNNKTFTWCVCTVFRLVGETFRVAVDAVHLQDRVCNGFTPRTMGKAFRRVNEDR